MKKLEIEDAETMQIAIQQEIQRSDESRYDHRLHGILLVAQGFSCYEVAKWFGQDSRTVQRWVSRFNTYGFTGLDEEERPGRPTLLNASDWSRLEMELRESPREFGYEQNLWDGKLLSHHLSHQYQVELGIRQCQRIFHKLGFRLRKPRPVTALGDPEEQKAYKKNSIA